MTYMGEHCCIYSCLCYMEVLQPRYWTVSLGTEWASQTPDWILDNNQNYKLLSIINQNRLNLHHPRNADLPHGSERHQLVLPLFACHSQHPSQEEKFFLQKYLSTFLYKKYVLVYNQIFITSQKYVFVYYQIFITLFMTYLHQNFYLQDSNRTLKSIFSTVL